MGNQRPVPWPALKEARLHTERNYVIREANAVNRVDVTGIAEAAARLGGPVITPT